MEVRCNMEFKLMIGFTILVLGITLYMGYRLYKKSETQFDIAIRERTKLQDGSHMLGVMKSVTRLGNVETLFIIIVPILFFLIRSEDFVTATSIIVAAGLSIFVSQLMKFIFRRNRPTITRAINHIGYSFPSGHATVGISFYLTIAYILSSGSDRMPVIAATGLCIGLAIAYSRISLGVHWASDVCAGVLLGLMCAWWAIYLYRMNYTLIWVFRTALLIQ